MEGGFQGTRGRKVPSSLGTRDTRIFVPKLIFACVVQCSLFLEPGFQGIFLFLQKTPWKGGRKTFLEGGFQGTLEQSLLESTKVSAKTFLEGGFQGFRRKSYFFQQKWPWGPLGRGVPKNLGTRVPQIRVSFFLGGPPDCSPQPVSYTQINLPST